MIQTVPDNILSVPSRQNLLLMSKFISNNKMIIIENALSIH